MLYLRNDLRRSIIRRVLTAPRTGLALVLAVTPLLGCTGEAKSAEGESDISEGEGEASEQGFGLRRYTQVAVSTTRDKRGGDERLCGEVRNTSPYMASLNVNIIFTASVGITGGLNLTVVKDWVTANLGVNASSGVIFSNSVAVGPVKPGGSAVVYCYAIGDYVTGTQTLNHTWENPRPRELFNVFVPKAVGYRVSFL